MTIRFIKNSILAGALTLSFTACVDDLDRQPFYDQTSNTVYADFANYKGVLAKLYAGYAVTGQSVDGTADLSGFDEGKSSYLRAYWTLQELPTDEAVIGWNDGTLFDIHDMDWTAQDDYVRFMYDRIYYQIALTNEFIRETTDDKLNSRGISGANLDEAKLYRAEARFLRALSYWHALDLFGSVPFVTEKDGVGAYFPEQISREDLFAYVESELLAIEPELAAARGNEYARADKAAAWTLLAKLYLNAQVYTGAKRYTDAALYAGKVIAAGYTLEDDYRRLFLADNNTARGIIFPVAFDGVKTKTWGGITYLVLGPIGGTMSSADFGMKVSGWSGQRTTQTIVNLFPDADGTIDERAMFYTAGQSKEVNDVTVFTDGYPITKYKNLTSAGVAGSDPAGNFPDTDFPMFRIEDVYLTYAEAVLRDGAAGDRATALGYINALRERAYNDASGNITDAALTLDFILDERARELNWEGHRRTDLIRFGKFTGSDYVWPWKGGVKDGKGVGSYRTVYPIPTSDMTANPNLKQLFSEYN